MDLILYHIFKHWKHADHYLYRYSMVIFLYSILNGMVSFLLPVLLEESIPSLSLVGIILASSSVWNIITDFVLGISNKSPSYRLLTRLVGMLLFILFGSIWISTNPVVLIFAAAIWGVYTELATFAGFNFVISTSSSKDRSAHFGLLNNFKSLGFALAPIMIGLAVADNRQMIYFTGIFFVFCFLSLFQIQIWQNKLPQVSTFSAKRRSLIKLVKTWFRVGKNISKYLVVFFIRGVADGVLTSFVPIFVEMKSELKIFGGFIVAGLSLPTAFVSGYFGSLADKWGRRKFIVLGLLISAVALLFFGFSTNPFLAIFLSLLIGIGFSLYVPPLEAELGCFVDKHHYLEDEVESESGAIYNFGFITGAGLTGFVVSVLGGFGPAFAILGLLYGLVGVGFWVKR